MTTTEGRKSLPYLLRFAARHPLRTLRRNQGKAIRRTGGFGLGQCVGCSLFVIAVVGWLTVQYVTHLS
ncbi:hypothetical protein ABZ851_30270 [Streptomyces sp. NPDC047049]|uniref:hypothetical protein n=1 Tax=Streptomyces sp. NPDC047049 TaxID=3156688 RepID=UPI0033D1064B